MKDWKKIVLKDINVSWAKRFLIAHVAKHSTIGRLHLLQWKYFSWCSITDKMLPWKLSKIVSLIQTKFQESNFHYLFTLFFCFWLLVKMANRRWHQATKEIWKKLPCCCLCSFWPNKGHSWCWSDDFSVPCFFLGKERDRDKERQVLALLRVF